MDPIVRDILGTERFQVYLKRCNPMLGKERTWLY